MYKEPECDKCGYPAFEEYDDELKEYYYVCFNCHGRGVCKNDSIFGGE